MSSPIITLITDFGQESGFPGVMKGVILGICPEAQIVDLSHEIPAHDILEAQFLLERAVPYFPDGGIYVAVVDPGVGAARRPILVRDSRNLFVGPDNGIFTPWLDEAEVRVLQNPEFFLPEISTTFHGRDIFSPAAAHIAAGAAPEKVGPVIENPVRKRIPPCVIEGELIKGEVVHVDSFGNLITNITAEILKNFPDPAVKLGEKPVARFVTSYGDVSPGEPLALIGSHGRLEIAICEGNASRRLSAGKGYPVVVKSGPF